MTMATACTSLAQYRGDFEDLFTGSNGDLLAERTGWRYGPGGLGDRNIILNTNALRGNNPSGGTLDQATLVLAPNMHSSDCWIEVDHYSTFNANRSLHAVIGVADIDNCVGIRCNGAGSSGIRLIKWESGTQTESVGVRGQGGAGYTYRIEKVGQVFEFFIDSGGGFSSEGTETYNHATGTEMGFRQQGNESGSLPLITTFRCGSLPPFV